MFHSISCYSYPGGVFLTALYFRFTIMYMGLNQSVNCYRPSSFSWATVYREFRKCRVFCVIFARFLRLVSWTVLDRNGSRCLLYTIFSFLSATAVYSFSSSSRFCSLLNNNHMYKMYTLKKNSGIPLPRTSKLEALKLTNKLGQHWKWTF